MTTETLTRPAPAEPTTPIKPSEAIRLGCLLAPVQLFRDVYVSGPKQAACVYGAMALGFYGWDAADRWADGLHGRAIELHDALQAKGPCPECGVAYGDPLHLNDDHRWSRERIADWLAGQGL